MRAIILAAGVGSRLSNITQELPKALVKVGDQTIIERQILFLHEVGITDIYVVIGYLHKKFEFLRSKYQVTLIYNPHYQTYNNFYSVYLAREYLTDCFVLEGDIFMKTNFLDVNLQSSTYFTAKTSKFRSEWVLTTDKDQVTGISIPPHKLHLLPEANAKAFVMMGVSFWRSQEAQLVTAKLTSLVNDILASKDDRFNQLFWDHIVCQQIDRLNIQIKEIDPGDWFEVDTIEDLSELTESIKSKFPNKDR